MEDLLELRYRIVDVFTTEPLQGNALAVFPDAASLDDATMQRIAKELNLSETTFVLPPRDPECLADVRIFTPTQEMRFAGHPTVGTAFVLFDEGKASAREFILEEKIGRVPIRIDGGDRPLIWLRTPPIRQGRSLERAACARALGLEPDRLAQAEPRVMSAGNPTIYIALERPEDVDRAWLDGSGYQTLHQQGEEPLCVMVFARTKEGMYSRVFAPEHGVIEDPATGSSTGPLAAYMIHTGLLSAHDGARFISEQGTKMGRRSLLHVLVHGEDGRDGIDVGGQVTPLAEGTMRIPNPANA